MAVFPAGLCATCQFYYQLQGDNSKSCVRFPPTLITNGATITTEYPQPKPTDSCGEYAIKL